MIKKRILVPFQELVKNDSFSGVLLFIASVVALIWANSPFGDFYQDLWQYKVGIKTEDFELYKPLILWVNDGLMAVFFFLIGLEVKREILVGELNTMKKLAFPLFGALGGVVFPILIFTLLNNNPETSQGWAIPMATDIAFALAIVKILGNKVPLSLKVFLTAFAIVDDIAAVAVIAIFYSSSLNWTFLLIALVLLLLVYYLTHRGMYNKYFSFLIGIVVWFCFFYGGIHPTLAGVFMAFAIAIRQKSTTDEFVTTASKIAEELRQVTIIKEPIMTDDQIHTVKKLKRSLAQYQSPLQSLEHQLHGFVSFFIMPVFALANAGVRFTDGAALDLRFVMVIALSLLLGKSIGIFSFVELAKRVKIVALSQKINKRHIIGIAFIAGVGFTMSLFIAGLAFITDPVHLDSAKLGVLVGSVISGATGYLILKYNRPPGEEELERE